MIILINFIYHWQTHFLLLKQNLLLHLLLQICTFQNVLSLCMKSQLLKVSSCFFISEVFFVFYGIVLRDCKLIFMWQLKNISYFNIYENFALYLLKVIYNFTISADKLSHSYGCWNVAKVEIFIICFIFMLYEILFLLYMSYLCYMFDYIFITYLYVYYIFLNLFYISIFTLFDFKFMW